MVPNEATPTAGPIHLGVSVPCRRCGFDLLGLPLSGMCPECGQDVAGSVPSEVLATIPGSVVESDRPCAVCGYNIRGLPVVGRCPECGASVEQSLLGRLLRFASPAYVATLHRGAFLVELSIALSICLMILGIFAGGFWSSISPAGAAAGSAPVPAAISLVSDGLFTAISVLGLVGWWMLSTPDPGEPKEAPGRRARSVLRIGVIGQLAAAAGSLVLGAIVAVFSFPVSVASTLLGTGTILDLVGGLAWVVSFFAAMTFIRHLAARIPDDRLATRAVTLRTFGAILIGIAAGLLVLILVFVAFVSAGAGGTAFGGLLGIVPCVGFPVLGLAGFIAFIMYVVLIDHLRSALRDQRLAASQPQRIGPPPVD